MTDHKAEWVLVPRVATEAMEAAGQRAACREDLRWNDLNADEVWDAMIAVAPANRPAASEPFTPAHSASGRASVERVHPDSDHARLLLDGDIPIAQFRCVADAGAFAHAYNAAAPAASEGEDGAIGNWGIDTSAGTPILVYKKCSVIEDEQARFVLDLIAKNSAAQVAATPKHNSAQGDDESWRAKAAEWLESKAKLQDENNAQWPEHAAAYESWRTRPAELRFLAGELLRQNPTPKHDEGREAWTCECGQRNASWATECGRCERLPPGGALATQPAARRVTDEDVERACAAGWNDWPSISPTIQARVREKTRAALESFAQPAEGVSGG